MTVSVQCADKLRTLSVVVRSLSAYKTRQYKTRQRSRIAREKLCKSRATLDASTTYVVENPVDREKRAHMTNTRAATLALAVAAAITIACGDRTTIVNPPTSPTSPFGGGPSTSTITPIEFRVTGSPASARIRYSTPADGDLQVITALPYTAGFTTTADAIFLSLDATPIVLGQTSFPFFSIQIVVNHVVFREASSTDFLFTTLAVSGTWRR